MKSSVGRSNEQQGWSQGDGILHDCSCHSRDTELEGSPRGKSQMLCVKEGLESLLRRLSRLGAVGTGDKMKEGVHVA